jgi:thiamine-phosphate diphosphorylase
VAAPRFQLHLVTEPRRGFDELLVRLTAAVGGGVDWIQLRNKSISAAGMLAEAQQLRGLVESRAARLAVNDRLDVALAAHAHAVHLAAQSLPVAEAVRLAEGRLLVGRSVHAFEEALSAAADGADYLTFGHVFPTTTHPGLPPRGLEELARIVAAVEVPVLAIGGITTDNLASVLATGCAGVAVISAILGDADPAQAAGRLRAALDAFPGSPRIPLRTDHAAHRQPTAV